MAALDKEVATHYSGTSGARNSFKFQHGFTGDRVTPTAYHMRAGTCTQNDAKFKWNSNPISKPNNDCPNYQSDLYIGPSGLASWMIPGANKAYSRFIDNAKMANTGLGETIAEWRSSLGLIQESAYRIGTSWRHIRRGEIREAIRGLTTDQLNAMSDGSYRRSRKSLARDLTREAGSTWLKYWFGIKPTMQSIYSSADAMSDQSKPSYSEGTGTVSLNPYGKWVTTSSASKWRVQQRNSGRYSCKIAANITVSNPNLALAAQLGLANPATLYELVPFSWLLDWVADVGSYLSAFSDLLGCEVSESYTTHFARGSVNWHLNYFGGPAQYQYDSWWNQDTVSMRRDGSLWHPLPNWNVNANLGTSITRAATAVSVLATTLLK